MAASKFIEIMKEEAKQNQLVRPRKKHLSCQQKIKK